MVRERAERRSGRECAQSDLDEQVRAFQCRQYELLVRAVERSHSVGGRGLSVPPEDWRRLTLIPPVCPIISGGVGSPDPDRLALPSDTLTDMERSATALVLCSTWLYYAHHQLLRLALLSGSLLSNTSVHLRSTHSPTQLPDTMLCYHLSRDRLC